MADQQYFLKSVRYSGEKEVFFQQRPALEQFEDGLEFLTSQLPRYVRLFSAPALKFGSDGSLTTSAWYGAEAGQAIPWAALGQTDKVRVANHLRAFVQDLMSELSRTNDPRARLILCWLPMLSLDQDLLVINGHPILTNWGLVPQGTMEFSDKLAHHLMHGLGQFLPEGVDVADVADWIAVEHGAVASTDDAHEDEAEPAKPAAVDHRNAAPTPNLDPKGANPRPDIIPPSFSSAQNQQRAQATAAGQGHRDAAASGLYAASAAAGMNDDTQRHQRQRPPRCWLPVLVACIVALLILLLLLLPGILIFPHQNRATALLGNLALQQSETALRNRIADLKTELGSRSCRAPATPATLPDASSQDAAPGLPASPAAPARTRVTDVVTTLDQATVLIVAGDGVRKMGSGSGFFIGPDLIVTNRHVVEASPKGHVIVVNKALGGARKGKVIATSANSNLGEQDYALIKMLGDPFQHHLTLSTAGSKGQQIYAAGYPSIFMETDEHFLKLLAGMVTSAPDMVLTQGIVTVLQDSPSGNRMVLHSADISPGNSGGPLADKCGRVIGVNTFVKTSSEQQVRLNFALKSDSLIAFLNGQGIQLEQQDGPCEEASPGRQAEAAE